jgi:hypothetical protein
MRHLDGLMPQRELSDLRAHTGGQITRPKRPEGSELGLASGFPAQRRPINRGIDFEITSQTGPPPWVVGQFGCGSQYG